MFKLASLFVEIGADSGPLNRALAGVRGQLAGLARMRFNVPGGGFAAMLGVGAAGAGLGAAINGASDLAETLSKVGAVFGDQAARVTKAADEMAAAFGIPKREFLDAASQFGLIAEGMGKTKTEAAEASVRFAKLAADAASFYNVPVAVALEKIRAGLTGESEPLKAFGVIMDETTMKAYAVSSGLARKGQELDNATKFAARAAMIEKGLATATGDLERTQSGAANQSRMFWGQLQNLGDTVGATVLPAFTKLLGLLNQVAADMSRSAQAGSGAWSSFAESFSGAIDDATVVYRNFGDIIERTGVMIGGWMTQAWESVAYGAEVAGATAGYLWESFREAFDLTLTAMGNLKDNFVGLLKEIWEAIRSGGTHVIDVKFRPLLDGAQFKGDGKFRMPEMAPRSTAAADQIAEIDRRMQDRADAKAKEKFDAADRARPGAAQGQAGQAGARGPDNSKVGVTDADAFARELQEGALKGRDVAGQQLAEAKEQTRSLQEIAKNTAAAGAGRPAPAVFA